MENKKDNLINEKSMFPLIRKKFPNRVEADLSQFQPKEGADYFDPYKKLIIRGGYCHSPGIGIRFIPYKLLEVFVREPVNKLSGLNIELEYAEYTRIFDEAKTDEEFNSKKSFWEYTIKIYNKEYSDE